MRSRAAQLGNAAVLARTMGPFWVAYRALYAAQQRGGHFRRRLPSVTWDERPLSTFLSDPTLSEPERYLRYRQARGSPFFFSPEDRASMVDLLLRFDEDGPGPVAEAERILGGVFRYFSHAEQALGFPPDWHLNPFTGERAVTERHWSEISEFAGGDIKVVWEPSRFGAAFPLVRAYWRTGDDRFAEAFWDLVEGWREANPPQRGMNWKCGQEAAFRLLAWCFGLYGCLHASATTPERVTVLAHMVAVSAERIHANLRYALSQQNNHGISEGVGLWTAGLLFPEFASASAWRDRGREVLEQQATSLIYDDGAFSQHSLNYHRLMLHDYLWAIRLGDVGGQPLSNRLRNRVGRSAEFLYQLQDDTTGRVPNYGQNDGALILPLDNCDYVDFRPVLQLAATILNGERRFESGPWDETVAWLYPEALNLPVIRQPRADLVATQGGYFTLRSESGFAFTRAPVFRHRPGQADLLHVDLWWRGINIARDPGTFSYNATGAWDNALSQTSFHNTVTVDGLEQMKTFRRFLWLPWARARSTRNQVSRTSQLAYWEGEHDGYHRLADPVCHQRGILRLGDEHWLVVDRLVGNEPHSFRLHWALPNVPVAASQLIDGLTYALDLEIEFAPYQVRIGVSTCDWDASMARADPSSPRGWEALHYFERRPILSVEVIQSARSAVFWTFLGPNDATVERTDGGLGVSHVEWDARIQLPQDLDGPVVSEAEFVHRTGKCADRLEAKL